MIPDRFVWFAWATTFLVPWLALYVVFPERRRAMLRSSLFTAPLGLTEPLFVPEYWNPPSLFDLAQRTGFDLESLIFCFGIGGVAAVLFDVLTRRVDAKLPPYESGHRRHRYHKLALASPFLAFVALYFFPWNPIYPGIVAMAVGAVATILCRRDLGRKTWIGGALFVAYYFVFLAGLRLVSPGYIGDVWNLDALSGWSLAGIPVEEFLFAGAFGMYWAGAYEHVTWRGVLVPGKDGLCVG